MASQNVELDYEFPPFLRVYKNGHVERLLHTDSIPAGTDLQTGVSSKDVTIFPDSEVYVRLYLPKLKDINQKLPVLVYFHGGGFCLPTPSSPNYHNYLNALVAEAHVVAISVHYRRPPEHPLPIAYEDSWAALQWVVSHSNGDGPEIWLNDHADFQRLFLSGDSAGANIAHNLAMAAGDADDNGVKIDILGVALIHPFFWGSDAIGSESLYPERRASVDKFWPFVCPSNPENDDPLINPVAEGAPSLVGLGCRRALVCIAEKDILKDRGWMYYHTLSRSGWIGVAEIHETEEEDHVFHLNDLKTDKAKDLISRSAAFLNRDMPPRL